MSGYVREKKFSIEFEGDVVTGTLLPLKQVDLLTLMGRNVESEDQAALAFADYLPRYVKDFVGPKAADGSEVKLEEVCTVSYFLKLMADIGAQLIAGAVPPSKPSETSVS
jgi:hypothetical protein